MKKIVLILQEHNPRKQYRYSSGIRILAQSVHEEIRFQNSVEDTELFNFTISPETYRYVLRFYILLLHFNDYL